VTIVDAERAKISEDAALRQKYEELEKQLQLQFFMLQWVSMDRGPMW
jgi:hypothetical protein